MSCPVAFLCTELELSTAFRHPYNSVVYTACTERMSQTLPGVPCIAYVRSDNEEVCRYCYIRSLECSTATGQSDGVRVNRSHINVCRLSCKADVEWEVGCGTCVLSMLSLIGFDKSAVDGLCRKVDDCRSIG